MTKGTILNIQRFCTDDGPGIRTTVFMKGCPLRCVWCHNPESQSKRREIAYDLEKCTYCKTCSSVCLNACHSFGEKHLFDRNACVGCGSCAEVCSSKAVEIYGKEVLSCEVLEYIKRDKIFYDTSGGGVTLSGGEPLFQYAFAADILKRCRESGIHTAIETSGFSRESALISVIKYCDLILFDIKETDDERHKSYTGVSLKPIFRNLGIINERKIPFIIRAPIIPTLNDSEAHLKALRDIRNSMEYCIGLQIMPYHKVGEHKYELFGRENSCVNIPTPTREMMKVWEKKI